VRQLVNINIYINMHGSTIKIHFRCLLGAKWVWSAVTQDNCNAFCGYKSVESCSDTITQQ